MTEIIEKKMTAGVPFVLPFRVKRKDGSFKDITGIAARIQLREKSNRGKVLHQWDDDSDELTREDANGYVLLSLPPEFTNTQKFSEGYIDLLLLTSPQGMRSPTIKVKFHKGVTE